MQPGPLLLLPFQSLAYSLSTHDDPFVLGQLLHVLCIVIAATLVYLHHVLSSRARGSGAAKVAAAAPYLSGTVNVPKIWSAWYLGPPRWTFATYSFVTDAVRRYGGLFRFKFRNHDVFFVSGDAWRNAFFYNRNLDVKEGMRLVSVHVRQIVHPLSGEFGTTAWMVKELTRTNNLREMLPSLVSDLEARYRPWGDAGTVELFSSVQSMIFQLVIRFLGPEEIADDPALVEKTMREVNNMEFATSLSSTLLTLIPTPARLSRVRNIVAFYKRFAGLVKKRQDGNERISDGLQLLIDNQYTTSDAIFTILGALIVSMLNTDVIAGWLLLYLLLNPEWQSKVQTEINAFYARESSAGTSSSHWGSALSLASIEADFPTLDACLNETLRLRTASVAFFRRNVGKDDVVVDGVRVPRGAFVLFPVADAHLAEDAWPGPDPSVFAPERFAQKPAEDEDNVYASRAAAYEKSEAATSPNFLGFGAGPHICTGRRFAQLLIKLVIISVLAQYDVEAVDASGERVTSEPPNDPMLFRLSKPNPGHEVFLRYKRREL